MNITWSVGMIVLSLAGGAVLGLAYFAGLWLTARATASAKRPGMLLALSFIGRVALLLGGLYLITRGDPFGLFAALVGFYLSRQATTFFIRGKEDEHASP